MAKRITQDQKDKVVALSKDGLSFSEISRSVGVSRMTVREISNGLSAPISSAPLTPNQIREVGRLFILGHGETKIASEMNITRGRARGAIQKLGLSSKDHKALCGSLPKDYSNGKWCRGCEQTKPLEQFRFHTSPNRKGWHDAQCLVCESEYARELNATPESKATRRKYRENNKEQINIQLKKKRDEDIGYRLRKIVSVAVYRGLKATGSQKDASCMEYLPFTIEKLKAHLTSLFEPWMTWENYGAYEAATWDDNDPLTWIWNIDHIIPQSDLPYSSMEDENFKICWALANLRPYSAKLNAFEGGNKTRHKAA